MGLYLPSGARPEDLNEVAVPRCSAPVSCCGRRNRAGGDFFKAIQRMSA